MRLSNIMKLDLKDSIIKSIICNLYSKILSIKDLEIIIKNFKDEQKEIAEEMKRVPSIIKWDKDNEKDK